jgi:hypothetical protein
MRKLIFAVVLVLSLPAVVFAGGPPWLCLPLEGVSEKNAVECSELLTAKLQDKIWKDADQRSVKVAAHEGEWYAIFPMEKNVGLAEVEAALKGSKFAVAQKRLRLFGHVILEIDPQKAAAKDLLARLDEIKEVAIAETTDKEGKLRVTIDLPYPVEDGSRERGSVGWDSFRRGDLNTDDGDRSPKSASDLPTYEDLQKAVSKSGGTLKNLRWSDNFACRTLGGVAAKKDGVGKSALK